jgi:hypothetical protein
VPGTSGWGSIVSVKVKLTLCQAQVDGVVL